MSKVTPFHFFLWICFFSENSESIIGNRLFLKSTLARARTHKHNRFTWPRYVWSRPPLLSALECRVLGGRFDREVGDTAEEIVAIGGRSVAVSVVPEIKHTESVDCYLGYLMTWSWVVTRVFFFSLYVLIRRLSTVDFSAHGLIASSRVENSFVYVCVFYPLETTWFSLSFSSQFFCALLCSLFRVPRGFLVNTILLSCFPCSEIHIRRPVAALTIAVGGLTQSRLVWLLPNGSSLVEYGQQNLWTLVDRQILAIRKVAFL